MKNFVSNIRELMFRLKLFIFGVRFYEVRSPSAEPVIFEQSYSVGAMFNIHFRFQKVPCTDFLLRRGELVNQDYISYIVTAVLDTDSPDIMMEFNIDINDKPFFFNGVVNGFGLEETRVLSLISDVYLDFLKSRADFAYSNT